MSWHGDLALGDTLDFKITTIGSSGAPIAVSSSAALVVYEDNSTTEITSGITLTQSFDARVGLQNIRLVTSSSFGYQGGSNYDAVFSVGSVDGTSVVGYVAGSFSIAARAAAVADAVWDEDATAHQTTGTFGQAIGDPGASTETIYDAVVTDAAGTNIAADIIAIEAQTDDIGVAGAGLSAIPWNASWDAEVQSEVNDALVALGLDHLVGVAVAGTDVVDDSIMAKLVSASTTADWDDFVNTTDSLQAIRDRGDAAWVTGAGASSSGIADSVWGTLRSAYTSSSQFGGIGPDINAILADTGTDGVIVDTNNDKTGYALSAAGVDAVWDEALAAHTTADTPGQVLNMLTQDAVSSSQIAIQSIIGQALSASSSSFTFNRTTDALEAIRNRGDAAWITATTVDLNADQSAVTIGTLNALADDTITAASIATDAIGADALAASAVDEIWDEPLAAHTTADTAGQVLNMLTQDAVSSSQVALNSLFGQAFSASSSDWTFDRTTDALEAIRNRGDAAWTTGAGASSSQTAAAVWGALRSGFTSSSQFGGIGGDINDILADTDSLDTTKIPEALVFTVAGMVDANIQAVNDVTVDGTGSSSDTWGPA